MLIRKLALIGYYLYPKFSKINVMCMRKKKIVKEIRFTTLASMKVVH